MQIYTIEDIDIHQGQPQYPRYISISKIYCILGQIEFSAVSLKTVKPATVNTGIYIVRGIYFSCPSYMQYLM